MSAELAGIWVNTWPSCLGPMAVEIAAADDGIVVHSRGRRSSSRLAWPADGDRNGVYAGIATDAPLAFSAGRDFDDGGAVLQGNLNLGLLVLGTYRWHDDRPIGYFTREFFVRRMASPDPDADSADAGEPLFTAAEYPASVDLKPALGRWINADASSHGIAEVRFEERGRGLAVRVLGADTRGPVDWGWTEAGVFATVDETGAKTLSLLASCRLGPMTSQLQIRFPGGILALANFTLFEDERRDYCTREFFYREE